MKTFLASFLAVIVIGFAGWGLLTRWPGWNSAAVYSSPSVRLSEDAMPAMDGTLGHRATEPGGEP